MSTRRRWTPETIADELRAVVADIAAQTGAATFPTRAELEARGLSGLYKAMGRNGGVRHFKTLLAVHATGQATAPAPAAAQPVAPSHEQIAERAYLLYLDGHPGSDEDRWLAAEQQLNAA